MVPIFENLKEAFYSIKYLHKDVEFWLLQRKHFFRFPKILSVLISITSKAHMNLPRHFLSWLNKIQRQAYKPVAHANCRDLSTSDHVWLEVFCRLSVFHTRIHAEQNSGIWNLIYCQRNSAVNLYWLIMLWTGVWILVKHQHNLLLSKF